MASEQMASLPALLQERQVSRVHGHGIAYRYAWMLPAASFHSCIKALLTLMFLVQRLCVFCQ